MSTTRWHDVTIPLRTGMAVWPGDPAFELTPLCRIENGDGCNTSRIVMATHTGTHVDAPWHFREDGKRLHEIDSALFFGEALLLDIPDVDMVHAADLGSPPLPPRVIIKTRNAQHAVDGPFREDFVALSEDAAQRLVDEGVRMVGVDYLSVAPFHQKEQDTHHILLGNGVLVVEGLVLKGLPPGACWFTMFPMALVGADGAPCRAFVGYQERRA